MVTVSLPSGFLDLEEPSGARAPTPVIFNQEGTTLAPREPAESDVALCIVTKFS